MVQSGNVVIDPDVQAVMEFMQQRVAAVRLVNVAHGVAAMAPIVWGRFQPREEVRAVSLEAGSIPVTE